MRRTLLTAVGVVTLALAVPGAALAHHGHSRHHHHHHKIKAHHAKFRFRHIGAVGAGASGPTGPTGPTGPSGPPTPENAGTVTSYSTTTNILEIKLNDESVVKGKVSDRTRIECVKATPPMEAGPGDQGPGDDQGEGDDQSRGDMSQGGWGDHKDGGDDDGGEMGTAEPPCDSSLLVPGAVVRAAELRIGPGGTEFESIVLVR